MSLHSSRAHPTVLARSRNSDSDKSVPTSPSGDEDPGDRAHEDCTDDCGGGTSPGPSGSGNNPNAAAQLGSESTADPVTGSPFPFGSSTLGIAGPARCRLSIAPANAGTSSAIELVLDVPGLTVAAAEEVDEAAAEVAGAGALKLELTLWLTLWLWLTF